MATEVLYTILALRQRGVPIIGVSLYRSAPTIGGNRDSTEAALDQPIRDSHGLRCRKRWAAYATGDGLR